MAEPISIPFELRGGSPVILECTLPDGSKRSVRVVPVILEAFLVPDAVHPQNPATPVIQIRASLTVE